VRNQWGRYGIKSLYAAVHLVAHLVVIAAIGVAAVSVADAVADGGWWFATAAGVTAFVLGAVLGSLVVGAYLAAAIGIPGLRSHANEAFAAARLACHKSFLRIHVEPEQLTVYAIGVDRSVKRRRRWVVADDTTDPSASWIVPTGTVTSPHLIEKVVIRTE
jgi:hypothetical protein